MAKTSSLPQQGLSLSRPPLFNGSDYIYWKKRMMVYMQAMNYELWIVVVQGPKIPTKEVKGKMVPKREDEWDESDIKVMQVNAMAMDMLYRACDSTQFILIATCESAKEIWDKLEMIYEGTDRVKQLRMLILLQEYDSFKMKPDESVSDMFVRFTDITNGLNNLGETYSDKQLVLKVLRSLPEGIWKPTDIVDRDLHTMSLDELMSYLMVSEMVNQECKKKKYDKSQILLGL